MGLSKEREIDVTFTVTVTSFGKPEKVEQEVALALGAAMHTTFGKGYRLTLHDGRPVVYDNLGHDGHDPDHPTALVIGEEVVR